MSISGVDVSFYQGLIDWAKLASRARFAYIRAAYGTYQDAMFATNWSHAKATGIPIGAYIYYYQTVDPLMQAQKLLSVLSGDFGELPIAVDVEQANEPAGAPPIPWTVAMVAGLRSCIEEIALRSGRKVVIYTGSWYWDPHGLGTAWPTDLWIAQYPAIWTPASKPVLPKAWSTYQFWQYSSTGDGALYGVPAAANPYIDLDVFNGDEAAFAALIGKPPAKSIRVTSAGQIYDVSLPVTLSAL